MWSSLFAVAGLWLAVSFGFWLLYRLFRLRDDSRQLGLLDGANALIDEGGDVFLSIRKTPEVSTSRDPRRGPPAPIDAEDLRPAVRILLDAIEANSAFFERASAANKKIRQSFGLASYPPLMELFQIRRDLWAASEVFLMEDIETLGVELADAAALDAFRDEAKALLFGSPSQTDDAVVLRIAIAREDAARFRAEIQSSIAQDREKNRLPRPSDAVALPLRAVGLIAQATREASYAMRDLSAAAQSLAHAMSSRGLRGAAEELRRVRGELPAEFAAAFDRAGGAARQGGLNLKRHYEFLLEAQELRARYAELLAKTPDLSEKGRQFVRRLEIERRAERMKETSEGALSWLRQRLVVGIAHAITALQHVQAKITPRQNKQLVLAGGAQTFAMAPSRGFEDAPMPPLRTLLPPATAFQRPSSGSKTRRPGPQTYASADHAGGFVRAGEKMQNPKAPAFEQETVARPKQIRIDKTRASLADRLSAIDAGDLQTGASPEFPSEKTGGGASSSKSRRPGLFRGKRA